MRGTNIKIVLQYDGTRYDGWQKQGNTDRTIQGRLERILERMTGQPVEVYGSGRTDAGVHALRQTANFYLPPDSQGKEWTPEAARDALNRYLPEDIAVLSVEEADPRFHARLHAIRKTYVYRIWNSPVRNVLKRRFQVQVEEPLCVENMRRAAKALCGMHDYRAFCSLKRFKKSTVRKIEEIRIEQDGPDIQISYTGDGFLYHMVRILTGTLVETGLGLRDADSMESLLESRDRSLAGRLMPPEGLMLMNVEY